MSVSVGDIGAEGMDFKEVWNYWSEDPARETASIGKPGEGVTGLSSLPDGNYAITINFQERRRFGDIQVSRESQNFRNFYVKTK